MRSNPVVRVVLIAKPWQNDSCGCLRPFSLSLWDEPSQTISRENLLANHRA
jgi:hypothetical protein